MVNAHKKRFIQAKKRKDKRSIAVYIINAVHNLDPPGRFLMEDPNGHITGHSCRQQQKPIRWHEKDGSVHPAILAKAWLRVGEDKVLEKVLHRLREKDKPKNERNPKQDLIDQVASENSAADGRNVTLSSMHTCTKTEKMDKEKQLNISACPPNSKTQKVGTVSISSNLGHDEDRMRYPPGMEVPECKVNAKSLSDFSQHNPPCSAGVMAMKPQQHEITLRQWIQKSKSTMEKKPPSLNQPTRATLDYVISALPIALKLTEFIIEAERYEQFQQNPISLSSIAGGNVFLRTKGLNEGSDDEIEYVWIMSCVGDTNIGPTKLRLFSMGMVMYELFSTEEPLLEGMSTLDSSSNNMVSMSSIDDNQSDIYQQRKRPMICGDSWATKLESTGMPLPVQDLLQKLIACEMGGYSGEDAYNSFDELRSDLQLMLDNPTRFLINIHTSPLPSLMVCDEIYERCEEISNLEELYQKHIDANTSGGAIISGGACVEKSKLANHAKDLTQKHQGCFLSATFDQNQDVKPLSIIGTLLDSLCELFLQDATQSKLKSVENALETSLGSQASFLSSVLPSLTRLVPSCVGSAISSNCVDSAVSMGYLFGELLCVISLHFRPISLFLDDIQFAEPASLLLLEYLTKRARESVPSIFFILCYRDNEAHKSGQLIATLPSMKASLEEIKLEEPTIDTVNKLVSNILCLSPQNTHQLSSELHYKNKGNPLFLVQLNESLREHGCIYDNIRNPRWAWDLNKILDLNPVFLFLFESSELYPEIETRIKVLVLTQNSNSI